MPVGWYTLDGKIPIPCDGAKYMRMPDDERRVGLDMIGDVRVSTVFIHLDHNFGEGPPLLFETMVFGGEHNEYQERYSTWEEAETGHARAVAMVKGDR